MLKTGDDCGKVSVLKILFGWLFLHVHFSHSNIVYLSDVALCYNFGDWSDTGFKKINSNHKKLCR